MTTPRFRPAAKRDLKEIWRFTAGRWGVSQADRYVRLLYAAAEDLATGRKVGRSAEHIRDGYARYDVESHVLFYRAMRSGEIEIVRILHVRMDHGRHL